jgi:hypothetical protein
VVQRVAGRVQVMRPGSKRFVTLGRAPVAIPFGTTVAAARGTVRVTVASPSGAAPASAEFYSGQFLLTQDPLTGIATLRLNQRIGRCTARRALRARKRGSPHHPQKQRSLWGDGGAGHFQTKGNYATAIVLGTVWRTTDSCQATVVSVAEGSVSVTDLVTGATQTVTSKQAVTVSASGGSSVARTRTTGATPEAGASYSGTGADYFNDAPTWTQGATSKISFGDSADAAAVTHFKGAFARYCGSNTSTVTDTRMPVSSSGHFGTRFSTVHVVRKVSYTTYVAISGQFNTGGTQASVSYLVDYGVQGHFSPAHPFSTANPNALYCATWVRGTVTAP